MAEKNHNLCCVFSQILPNVHFIIPLVNSSHHGAVGSASAWRTRGCGFEPVLMRFILAENIPVLSGRLFQITKLVEKFGF